MPHETRDLLIPEHYDSTVATENWSDASACDFARIPLVERHARFSTPARFSPLPPNDRHKSTPRRPTVAAVDKYYCNSRALEPLDSINISHRRWRQTHELYAPTLHCRIRKANKDRARARGTTHGKWQICIILLTHDAPFGLQFDTRIPYEVLLPIRVIVVYLAISLRHTIVDANLST